MLKEIKKILFSLDLSESEIKIFLAAIQIGPAVVSKISRQAGFNRASAYDVIRRLLEKGLIRKISHKKIDRYEAINPLNITNKLTEKKNQLEENIKILEKLKPEFNALYNKRYDQPTVAFYEGLGGIKTMLLDTLEEPKTQEILSYASADYLKIGFDKNFLDKYWQSRTEQRIPTRGLIPATPEAKRLFTSEKNQRELRRVKFIPPDYKFTNEIDIYADKISIISLDKKNPYGVIIKSQSIAETQRNIYELLWHLL